MDDDEINKKKNLKQFESSGIIKIRKKFESKNWEYETMKAIWEIGDE